MISPKEFALQHKTGLCEYYLEIYSHTYDYSLKFSKIVHRIQGIMGGGGGGGGRPGTFPPQQKFSLSRKNYTPH